MSLNFGKQWRRRPHSPPDWDSWYHKQPYKYKKTAETLYSSSRPTRLHSYSVTGPRIFQPGSPFTVWVLLSLSVDNNLVITWICWWICIAKPPNSQSSLPLWPLYTAVEYPGGFILDSLSIFTQTDELKICFFGEDCFKMKYVIVAVAWMERGGLSANLSLSAGRV